VLLQVHDPADEAAGLLSEWFAESLRAGSMFALSALPSGGREVEGMTSMAAKLRWVVQQCGQGHWPVREAEYTLALFATMLPMVRWTTLSERQRRLALTFATLAGSALLRDYSDSLP
jgi:hypothetical protein